MKCTSCGKENPPDYKFCDACGEGLHAAEIVCPTCSHLNLDDMKFCEECGMRLGVSVCPSCSHENPLEFKFCEECGNGLVEKSSSQLPPGGKERELLHAVEESPIIPARDNRENPPRLLASLVMRFLFSSVIGFGAERVLNWVATALLTP